MSSSIKKFFSSYRNPKLIEQATVKLLEDNIETLINDIYSTANQDGIFAHPEARIGVVLKLLNQIRIDLDESVLRPVIIDIETLLHSDEYLNSTGNPQVRRKCLREELQFVNRYIDLTDTITLNTIEDQSVPTPEIKLNPQQVKRSASSQPDQPGECVIN